MLPKTSLEIGCKCKCKTFCVSFSDRRKRENIQKKNDSPQKLHTHFTLPVKQTFFSKRYSSNVAPHTATRPPSSQEYFRVITIWVIIPQSQEPRACLRSHAAASKIYKNFITIKNTHTQPSPTATSRPAGQ